jgi:hypothetical protein
MPLISRLFSGDSKLQACLVSDPAHLTKGTVGDHVSKIHTALLILDDAQVASSELQAKTYGTSTAAAVLAYKSKRGIINFSYQNTADDIVGKMTIARMDTELAAVEAKPPSLARTRTSRPVFT